MGTNAWAAIFVVAAWAIFWCAGEFIERGLGVKRFPEKSLSYEVRDIKDLAQNHKATAAKYVMPVLFPIDLFVMILLGGSMALASVLWARGLGLSPHWLWLVLLLPVAYVAVDLAEDTLLAVMLTLPGTIDGLSGPVRALTAIKMATVFGAAIETAGLFAWSVGKLGMKPFLSG
jgi:hypothetical protein